MGGSWHGHGQQLQQEQLSHGGPPPPALPLGHYPEERLGQTPRSPAETCQLHPQVMPAPSQRCFWHTGWELVEAVETRCRCFMVQVQRGGGDRGSPAHPLPMKSWGCPVSPPHHHCPEGPGWSGGGAGGSGGEELQGSLSVGSGQPQSSMPDARSCFFPAPVATVPRGQGRLPLSLPPSTSLPATKCPAPTIRPHSLHQHWECVGISCSRWGSGHLPRSAAFTAASGHQLQPRAAALIRTQHLPAASKADAGASPVLILGHGAGAGVSC